MTLGRLIAESVRSALPSVQASLLSFFPFVILFLVVGSQEYIFLFPNENVQLQSKTRDKRYCFIKTPEQNCSSVDRSDSGANIKVRTPALTSKAGNRFTWNKIDVIRLFIEANP